MEKLDAFPVHGNQAYPWEQLLDGGIYRLKAGQDFKARPQSVRSLALGQARKRGGKVKTSILEGDLVIQFVKTADTEPADTEPVNDYNGERD